MGEQAMTALRLARNYASEPGPREAERGVMSIDLLEDKPRIPSVLVAGRMYGRGARTARITSEVSE